LAIASDEHQETSQKAEALPGQWAAVLRGLEVEVEESCGEVAQVCVLCGGGRWAMGRGSIVLRTGGRWGGGIGVLCGEGRWGWGVSVLCGGGRWGGGLSVLCGGGRWGGGLSVLCGGGRWGGGLSVLCGGGRWGGGTGVLCLYHVLCVFLCAFHPKAISYRFLS